MSALRCPRCFRREDPAIHVCAPLAPVRSTPTPVRVVEEQRRKPGRPRNTPKKPDNRPKMSHGGARNGAGRPASFDDDTLRRAIELRNENLTWAQVGERMGVDDGHKLRHAINHRRSQDPDAFERTENRGGLGGAQSVFTLDELGAAQRMREAGMPWAQVASNLDVADVGQLRYAVAYRRRRG